MQRKPAWCNRNRLGAIQRISPYHPSLTSTDIALTPSHVLRATSRHAPETFPNVPRRSLRLWNASAPPSPAALIPGRGAISLQVAPMSSTKALLGGGDVFANGHLRITEAHAFAVDDLRRPLIFSRCALHLYSKSTRHKSHGTMNSFNRRLNILG